MPMQALLKDLCSVLKREKELIGEMQAAATRQSAALRKNDPVSLGKATGDLLSLAQQMELLKNDRLKVQAQLARRAGLPEGARLAGILEALPPVPERWEAQRLVDDLRLAALELAAVTRLNNLLAQNGLRFCEQLLAVLGQGTLRLYHPGGTVETSTGSPSILDKSV